MSVSSIMERRFNMELQGGNKMDFSTGRGIGLTKAPGLLIAVFACRKAQKNEEWQGRKIKMALFISACFSINNIMKKS